MRPLRIGKMPFLKLKLIATGGAGRLKLGFSNPYVLAATAPFIKL
jgi:hypothetical protein